jgi:hypothetical protein
VRSIPVRCVVLVVLLLLPLRVRCVVLLVLLVLLVRCVVVLVVLLLRSTLVRRFVLRSFAGVSGVSGVSVTFGFPSNRDGDVRPHAICAR